jgi:hypothetical protein
MAKRRSRLPRNLGLLAVAGLLGWAGWQYWPDPQRRAAATTAPVDACALAPAPVLAQLIGRAAVEARRMPSARDVPAASACVHRGVAGARRGRAFARRLFPQRRDRPRV